MLSAQIQQTDYEIRLSEGILPQQFETTLKPKQHRLFSFIERNSIQIIRQIR